MTEAKPSYQDGAVALRPAKEAGMFSALQHRNFRLLIVGFFFANSGMQIRTVAQGWLVYDLTNSPFLLGLVGTVASLPMLLFAPLIGVFIDRMDRKKLLLSTQSVSMVALFTLATLTATGRVEVWHVFAFALTYGAMLGFYAPTRQAFVPEVVDQPNLANAIALAAVTNQFTRIVGPSLASGLLVFVGLAGCFYFAGFTYAGIIGALLLVSVKSRPAGDTSATVWQNFREGLAYVTGNKTMFALIAMEAVPAIFGWQYQMLMPIFAKDILDVGAGGLGLLMAASGVGALIGALVLAALGDFRWKGLLLLTSVTMFGVTLILFALSSSFHLSLFILVLVGGTATLYTAQTNILVQTLVPNELRGRTLSFLLLAFNGMLPLGSLQAGTLAASLGAPTALIIGGSVVLAFPIALMFLLPRLRQL